MTHQVKILASLKRETFYIQVLLLFTFCNQNVNLNLRKTQICQNWQIFIEEPQQNYFMKELEIQENQMQK